jgi:cyclophilin family peptidyl-prolyl cis-trans isomerase/HEAT repeat protein
MKHTIAALVLCLSACAAPATPGSRVAPVRDASALALDARLLAMADTRVADTTLLDSLLQNAHVDARAHRYRARAALLVGQLQLRARYASARALLVHADTSVAATAAFALGLVRDTSSLVALSRAVVGAPDAVAAEAAWSLGRIGEPARESLLAALPDASSHRAPSVRVSLLLALSSLRPVPSQRVTPFLRDADANVAFAAAYAIARARAADGVRALLAEATHADAMVRTQVALAAAYNASGDSLADPAVAVLRALLRDPDARVRVQATRSIASHRSLRDARELVIAGLRDADASVRVTAAESLAPLVAADSALWRTVFAVDTTFVTQRTLLDAAVRNGALLDQLHAWRTHADPWARVASLEFSANVTGAASALDRLSWARRDTSDRVRSAAIAALGPMLDSAGVRDSVRAYLGDPSPVVRAAALGALTARASADDVAIAMARYATDSLPHAHAVRSAALRVIAAAWRRDSARFDVAAREQLARLRPPQDPLVRRSVNLVTPLSAWREPATVPSLSHYTAIAREWMHGPPVRTATMRTERGTITIELLAHDAPMTVHNFATLARSQYYNGTRFHRVIANFVAQDGDPTGTGSGGPGTSIRDELNRHRYTRGAVGMALSGPDTGGSQYYLTLTPQPHLDGGYTVFGRVVDGFAVMDALVLGDRILSVSIQ